MTLLCQVVSGVTLSGRRDLLLGEHQLLRELALLLLRPAAVLAHPLEDLPWLGLG